VFKLVLTKELDVLEISVDVVNALEFELCHFVTVPVDPDKVSVVVFEDSQTEFDPEITPPTDVGLTTTTETEELISVLHEDAAPDD
jgi:hypothetical protein